MKVYPSNIWGEVDEPESFIELMSLITHRRKPAINVYYWRGQSNVEWTLDSSIVRKIKSDDLYKDKNGKELDRMINSLENKMLSEAKKNLYDYDIHNRKLSDIELLAKLQHYGAATRLLDFSKSALIALWFCVSCSDNMDRTGLLFGIDTDVVSGLENKFDFAVTYASFISSISNSNNVCIVDSPACVSRITSQQSVFLCSKSVDTKFGTFAIPNNEFYLKTIAISPRLKKECIKVLSECFNITPFTIFPDIEGFADAYSSKWKCYEFTRW